MARVKEAIVGLHGVHRLVLRRELQQTFGLLDVGDRLPVKPIELHAVEWALDQMNARLRREQISKELHVKHDAAHVHLDLVALRAERGEGGAAHWY